MDLDRSVAFDIDAYVERVRNGPCFICAIVAGDPAYGVEEIVYEDDDHIAFLARYCTLPGYVLVSPKAHVEHVVRELDEVAYTALMLLVRRVALAVEAVVPQNAPTCSPWAASRATPTCTGTSPPCPLARPTRSSSTTP